MSMTDTILVFALGVVAGVGLVLAVRAVWEAETKRE